MSPSRDQRLALLCNWLVRSIDASARLSTRVGLASDVHRLREARRMPPNGEPKMLTEIPQFSGSNGATADKRSGHYRRPWYRCFPGTRRARSRSAPGASDESGCTDTRGDASGPLTSKSNAWTPCRSFPAIRDPSNGTRPAAVLIP